MRYGVLHDLAAKVLAGGTVDLAMGHANIIWQGDANEWALRSLAHLHRADLGPQRERPASSASAPPPKAWHAASA
jgi:hypothetical protein